MAEPQLLFAIRKAKEFREFLSLLNSCREYAFDLKIDSWDFSLGVEDAERCGISPIDLKWMLQKKWLATKNSHGNDRIDTTAKFVICPLGVNALEEVTQCQPAQIGCDTRLDPFRGPSISEITPRPKWDPARHELLFNGWVVKQYRWPAVNQEMILIAFEEEGWPPRIDDPLPNFSGLDPKRRLSDTIKCLNRNQKRCALRFRGDGTGEGILWDLLDYLH